MKIIIALILVAFLAGCSTSGDVMHRNPVASFASLKSVNVVTGCLAPTMLAAWPQTKVVPSDAGQMIIVSGSMWGSPIVIFTVAPAKHGSRVTVRRGHVVNAVFDSVEASARGCA